jgi:uncharacterized protein YbjT (DUF2867 family)
VDRDGIIAVAGATGRQGGAVVRHLLADGWRVRALTRMPDTDRGRRLKEFGAEVVGCDMADVGSLVRVFGGARGVYSVQNPMIAGFGGEVIQGKNVADAANRWPYWQHELHRSLPLLRSSLTAYRRSRDGHRARCVIWRGDTRMEVALGVKVRCRGTGPR